MRGDEGDLVEGRARRRAPLLAVLAMAAVVAVLPFVAGALRGDRPAVGPPPPVAPSDEAPIVAEGLHGRLVYSTFETGGPGQRLVVLDLDAGVAVEGPLVPTVEELAAAGPGGPIVIVADDAGAQGIAYTVPDLSRDARPVELARGDVLALSADGAALLVGRNRPGRPAQGCARNAYRATRVSPLLGPPERPLLGAATGCGTLVSGVLEGAGALLTVVDEGSAGVRVSGGPEPEALAGLAVLSRSPRGTYVLADLEGDVPRGLGVWPRTPTGPLLVWPGAGSPRPLVRDVRLFGQRVIAWSRDGSHVVVSGIVGDRRGMWLVYVPGGTMIPLLPPNSFPLRSAFSGATFDDEGTAFAGGPGVIVAATGVGVFPLPLPADAPTPIGPVAWLP